MERIVILKGPSIESVDEFVMRKCLKIMFPEYEIEIRLRPPADIPNEKSRVKPGKDKSIS